MGRGTFGGLWPIELDIAMCGPVKNIEIQIRVLFLCASPHCRSLYNIL